MLTGAGALVVGRYGVAGFGWLGTVLMVRHLTDSQWGELSFVLSLLSLVGFVSDLKLSRIVLAEVIASEEGAGDVVGSYVGLRSVIGLVSYAVALAWVIVGDYSSHVVLVTAIAGLNLVILSAGWGIGLLFEARLWLRSIAWGIFLGQALQFTITVAAIVLGHASVAAFAWATVANSAFFVAFLLAAGRHGGRLRVRVQPAKWGVWLKEAAPLALGSALDTVYFRLDIVMLSLLGTFTAVGVYSVGYKFSDLIGAIPAAVITPAAALLISHWGSGDDSFHRTVKQAYLILCVAAVGAGVGFFMAADRLVPLLYTERFADATTSARLLVVGQAIHFSTMLWFIVLVAANRRRLYPVTMLLGVVLNIGLNLFLIPRYSYNGAGWATVITELVVSGVLAFGALRIDGVRPLPLGATAKVLFAAAVMATIAAVGRQVVPWWVALILGGFTYFALLHLMNIDGPGGLRALARDARMGGLTRRVDDAAGPGNDPQPA
jgi:O-antigen/teichoic acid export membrane protein